ncbi:dihydrofolate reductase [Desulfoluna sp.]|uniref:dihydrofolate reductase n=1 Tax=Desulfoluna sp. TaxID=2045199 RepID=UPI00261508F0|nr:dihydrofolate reductase [Desulfoluna sp.]
MKVSFIVAVADNGVIGDGADIPWQIEGELSLFKAMSYHHSVLMGRKTWESIGRPLPGRKIIVLTRNPAYEAPGCQVCTTLDEALTMGCKGGRRLVVAGGGEIFKATLPFADTLHISHIHTEVAGDVLMPEIPAVFKPVFSQDFPADIPYTYTIYLKKAGEY